MDTHFETDGGLLVARPAGPRIDAHTSPEFKAAVLAQLDAGPQALIIDMREVEFIDSTGLGVLVSFMKTLAPAGSQMALANVNSERIVQLLTLTRMDRILQRHDSLDAARLALADA